VTEFDKVIPPGGVGKITASLDTAHYKGVITKAVSVTTNDPATPQVVLQLKGDIVVAIDVKPNDTPVLRTTLGETKPTELTLSAVDGKAFDILTVEADPALAVKVRPAPGSPPPPRSKKAAKERPIAAGSSRYLVTLTPTSKAPVGQSRPNVKLGTNHPNAEVVPINAVLMVAGLVQVVPPVLGVRPGGDEIVVHATISKPNGGALKILGVTSSDPDFTATTKPVVPGRQYDLTLKYTGKPGRGAVNSAVTVKTNEPLQATIVIPVSGRI
jgi:hypothetical protein